MEQRVRLGIIGGIMANEFTPVVSGAFTSVDDVNQLIEALKGDTGKGVPISLTALDENDYPLDIRNLEDAVCKLIRIRDHADAEVLKIENDLMSIGVNMALAAGKYFSSLPVIIARNGGHASNWNVAGTADQSDHLGNVAVQLGVSTISKADNEHQGLEVSFQTHFTYTPVVLGPFWMVEFDSDDVYPLWAAIADVNTEDFLVSLELSGHPTVNTPDLNFLWVAIGPMR
jgi:hypothetical protein